MPVIRISQPRTAIPRPSYQIGSTAARLARAGLNSHQVDAAHPAPARIRGAGHAPAPRHRSPLAVPAERVRRVIR